jgi:hypothetical protein
MPQGKYVKSGAAGEFRYILRRFAACARVKRRQTVEAITDVPRTHCLDFCSMGVKYYTHFVLTGEATAGSDQEFSGVVEVNQATDLRYETKEIEALLARNFDLRSGDVRLINWARLQ